MSPKIVNAPVKVVGKGFVLNPDEMVCPKCEQAKMKKLGVCPKCSWRDYGHETSKS